MELLVKRDRTVLVPCEGRAELDAGMPVIFKTPHVIPQSHVLRAPVYSLEDRLIMTEKDNAHMLHDFRKDFSRSLPALWSGYRSALVGRGGKLFRLKGVSLDLQNPPTINESNGTTKIFGGQPQYAAEFEKEMSDEFNSALQNEGVAPVMECKGYWHYPLHIGGYGVSASVIEVKGDTRLDELVHFIEAAFKKKINYCALNNAGFLVATRIKQLYSDIGYIVGRLKRIMTRNNQTWNADEEYGTNAHVGNVVLYHAGSLVKFGFVDFDSSCNRNDYSLDKLKKLQYTELNKIINSIDWVDTSTRKQAVNTFYPLPTSEVNPNRLYFFRNAFVQGFRAGYASKKSKVSNAIPYARFAEIFAALKSEKPLSKPEKFKLYNGPYLYASPEFMYNIDSHYLNEHLKSSTSFQQQQ